MDEPRRRNQSWSAARARTHASIGSIRATIEAVEGGSIPLPDDGEKHSDDKVGSCPDLGKSSLASPFRDDDRSLTADLSMVESHFYAAAAADIACRARALYPISVAHVRMNMRTKEKEGGSVSADGGRHEQYQGIGIVMRHVPSHPIAIFSIR